MYNFHKKYSFYLYKFLIKLISFYQKIISPVSPARCRYYPTCSNYGKQALAWHGVRSGSWLLLRRIGRCQPWGGHGVDFVPLPLALYRYQYVDDIKMNIIDGSRLPINSSFNSVYRDSISYVARLNYLMRS